MLLDYQLKRLLIIITYQSTGNVKILVPNFFDKEKNIEELYLRLGLKLDSHLSKNLYYLLQWKAL